MNDTTAPLRLLTEPVRPEWIDYNGHMNAACYAVAFDRATDAFLDHVQLGKDYVKAENRSVFVGELHIYYQREVTEGQPLAFDTQIIGVDPVRIHIFHTMRHAGEGWSIATCELLLLHVDLRLRRAFPMPAPARARLTDLAAAHAALPVPQQSGRSISLKQQGA
jgi:acyl-CoA thioester hydrolase